MQRRAPAVAAIALAAVLVAASGAGSVSAANDAGPPRGTPDPRAMVLTSDDLGGARVTAQRYFKDRDFPSVISYVREFEDATSGATALGYVESQAEIGTSAAVTARFLALLRRVFASKETRAQIVKSFREELGASAPLVSNVEVGRPRNLGVLPGSFDLLVSARVLGRRVDLHIAVFAVERVLGLLTVVGRPGRAVPLAVMTRLGRIMAARTIVELVPQNLALPSVSGTPAIGETLTANPGRWTGNPASFAYAWQRCDAAGTACTNAPGGTGRTYVVADADVGSTLRVAVTARGALRSEAAQSARTGVVAVFVDTFDGAGLSPSWWASTTGSGPTASQANGQLEITLPAGTVLGPDGYAITTVFSSCRLPGDFDMQVDYRLLSGLPPGVNVGFEAAEFTSTTYSGQHGVFIANLDGGQRITTHFPNPPGALGLPYNSYVPDSARSGTLRLVRATSGGVTTMTASRLTGTPWSFTSLSYPQPLPTSQAASFHLFTNVAPAPGEVRVAFDNFRISSGALTCS